MAARVNQLRGQVATLEEEAEPHAAREQPADPAPRHAAADAQGDVTRRVGALEVSLPNIVEERLPETAGHRPSATASIAAARS
jgi:hypothetical protein